MRRQILRILHMTQFPFSFLQWEIGWIRSCQISFPVIVFDRKMNAWNVLNNSDFSSMTTIFEVENTKNFLRRKMLRMNHNELIKWVN